MTPGILSAFSVQDAKSAGEGTKCDCDPSLFLSARQHRLKMRRLFLTSDDVYFNFFKTGLFQPAMQIAFRKTQPTVTVKFVGPLELVPGKVQDHNVPARLQQFVSARQGSRRLFGMMQRLA